MELHGSGDKATSAGTHAARRTGDFL